MKRLRIETTWASGIVETWPIKATVFFALLKLRIKGILVKKMRLVLENKPDIKWRIIK